MGKNEINYQKPVIDYFKNLVSLHGEDIRSLDWGGRSSQSQRFRVLYEIGIGLESSVLDVGCGHGDFYGYLIRKGFCGTYSGVDLTPEMIVIAKNKYNKNLFLERDVIQKPFPDNSFEFVIASGIFYIKINDNFAYLQMMVTTLYNMASKGIAFNCLRKGKTAVKSGEFYFDPKEILKFGKTLTQSIELVDNYRDNDFTIYMKKSNGD